MVKIGTEKTTREADVKIPEVDPVPEGEIEGANREVRRMLMIDEEVEKEEMIEIVTEEEIRTEVVGLGP